MATDEGRTARSWAQLVLVAGVLAVLLGALTLLGWLSGSTLLTTFAASLIPMAPSTGVLFLLFGGLLIADLSDRASLPRWLVTTLAGAGTAVALVILVLSTLGVHSPLEHLGMEISGQVADAPIGHMSPVTALAFILAGSSFLLNRTPDPWRIRAAFIVAALLEFMAVVLTAAYVLGQPLLYDTGVVPPALNTSVGFVALGGGLLGSAANAIWAGAGDRGGITPRPVYGLLAVLVLAIGGILVPAYLLFERYQEDFRENVESELAAVANLKTDQILEWRAERMRDAVAFYANSVFADLVDRAVYGGDPDARASLDSWLEPVVRTFQYERIEILDSTGVPVLSVPPQDGPLSLEPHRTHQHLERMRSGGVTFEGFHRHGPDEPIHLTVFAPIAREGEAVIGAVEIRVDPTVYLYPVLMAWPTPSPTAETLLVRRDGDDVLFLNDLRFRDDAALNFRIPLSRTDLPAAQAILGEEGIVRGIDYRGEPVVAAVQAIPGTDWRLVARMDVDEAYGPLRERLGLTLGVVGLLLLSLIGALGFAWQRREKLHYRSIVRTERRHQALIQSIGDAVIATDVQGRVEVINPVAARLTGWPESEAIGRPLAEVFRIVNEETGETVESPVAKVLRTGRIVGLANSTMLVARDGTERPIADSGAPVVGNAGEIVGVILVFRDQTRERAARRRLQEEVERAERYLDVAGVMIVELDQEGRVRLINDRGARILGYSQADIIGRDWFENFIPAEARDEVREIFDRAMAGEVEQFENEVLTQDGEHRIIAWKNAVLRNESGQIVGTVSSGEDITQQRRAEAELRRSEAKHRNLFDSIRDAILVTNTDREIIDWNPAFEELFGYEPEEIRGRKTLFVYEDEEEHRRMGRELEGHIGDPNFTMTVHYRTKSGQVFPGETNAFYLRDDEGEIVGFIGLIRDISERKQAEQALAESEARYRTLFEDAPVGIFRTRSDGRVLQVNPTMAKILGLDSPDEAGEYYTDLATQLYADPARRDEFIERLNQDGEVNNFRYLARTADDRRVWLEMDAQIDEFYDDGTFVIEGFAWDITKRKEAQDELREHQRMLERTEEIAHIGSWELDVESGEVQWSDELFRIFQRDPSEGAPPLGENSDLFAGNDLERLRAAVQRAIREGEPYDLEVDAIRSDGEVRHCRALGYPETDADGRVTTLYGAFDDITERREREEREAELRAQLSQAQKMEAVGRLAGGVAHDFNNMLSVILGHTELAKGALVPDHGVVADLEKIEQAAESSVNLTRQLLAFAREQVAQPQTLDLNEVVSSMLKMLRRLIGEEIELVWKPADDVWPVRVDPVQVDQILANLLVNARDAIDGVGQITIGTDSVSVGSDYVEQHADAEPGDYVMLSVIDTGCGIDPDVQERIFEPFFTTKASDEGSGLGLATVYGIVRQNDGFINVYSEPGVGTTFKVYFPRVEGEAAGKQTDTEPKPAMKTGDETVLVVEDQEAVLELVKKILGRLGYTTLSASSPLRAIEVAAEHAGAIDLLVTDVILPEMNGRELADRLVHEYPGLATLFMSGYAEDVIAQRGVIEAGVHFVEKPFTAAELAARVREALDSR